MVYTDGVHLVADTLDELHWFAKEIGLKREWFQDHRHKHYDMTTQAKVRRALLRGAKMVSSQMIVEISRRVNDSDRQGNNVGNGKWGDKD